VLEQHGNISVSWHTLADAAVIVNESFIRVEGQLDFVSIGLFKEYTAIDRDRPFILNFIHQIRQSLV